jgi:flagellar hook protein FlgE
LLNDLDSNTADYVSGDQLQISGTNADGSAFSVALPVDATSTLGDIVTALNGQLTDAVASIDSSGNLVVTANNTGDANLGLNIVDDSANTGATTFGTHSMSVQTEGKGADVVETTATVYDTRGESHALGLTFEKVDSDTWNLKAQILDGSGQLVDDHIWGLQFGENGQFRFVSDPVEGAESSLKVLWDDLSVAQEIELDFSILTHMATDFVTTIDQDGFPPGNLAQVTVNPDGTIDGIATNGRRVPIAQLAIANFRNAQALESQGNNYYSETANSGPVQVGPALAGGRGMIIAGQLEASNVDIALEFTQLIVAQRGFSANARTITAADEVLQELVQIVR